MAGAYQNPQVAAGLILGTGTNLCFSKKKQIRWWTRPNCKTSANSTPNPLSSRGAASPSAALQVTILHIYYREHILQRSRSIEKQVQATVLQIYYALALPHIYYVLSLLALLVSSGYCTTHLLQRIHSIEITFYREVSSGYCPTHLLGVVFTYLATHLLCVVFTTHLLCVIFRLLYYTFTMCYFQVTKKTYDTFTMCCLPYCTYCYIHDPTSVKRDLLLGQKRPTTGAKETY